MKRIIAIILSLCLVVGAFIPPVVFAQGDGVEYLEVYDGLDDEWMETIEDVFEYDIFIEDNELEDEGDIAEDSDDAAEDDDVVDEDDELTEDDDISEDDEVGDDDDPIEEDEDEVEEDEEDEESEEDEDDDGIEDIVAGGGGGAALYLNVEVNSERDVTVSTAMEIIYEVVDEDGEGDIIILIDAETFNLEIYRQNTNVSVPLGWMYEIDIDNNAIVITPPEQESIDAEYLKIHIELDDERNVTITAPAEIIYEIIDDGVESDIIIVFESDETELEISEDDISFELPDGWVYKVENDADSNMLTVTLSNTKILADEVSEIYVSVSKNRDVTVAAPTGIEHEVVDDDDNIVVSLSWTDTNVEVDEGSIIVSLPVGWTYEVEVNSYSAVVAVKPLKAYIELDNERNVTVTAYAEFEYEVVDEFGEGDIVVTLKPKAKVEINEDSIGFRLPVSWVYEIEEDAVSNEIVITLSYNMNFFLQRMTSPFFTAEEMNDMSMWYARPDFEITLAETPTNNVYTRLRNAIQNATPNAVTHIIIPFHINTGSIGTNGSVVRVPNGASVVLIGAHPSGDNNGQIVISDTHGTGAITRVFRVRGNNNERCALILRNVAIQNADTSTAQATPETPPNPIALNLQTGNTRSGGVAIEQTDGGGGHFILCRGGEIRNNTTNNNGAVDVQVNGRFTMMPGSFVRDNAAGNSGGGVNVSGANSRFDMYGGTISNNTARGENTISPEMRAVGGGVLVQNGGTFTMYDGYISNNKARLDEIASNPSTTNALVSSSGGGVFVTGSTSSFNMRGGTISNNEANRARASNLSSGTLNSEINNRFAFRAGNGGGVFLNNGATFNMHDGTIENNIATTSGTLLGNDALNVANGGGVYMSGANTRFFMHDGTIRGNQALRTLSSIPNVPRNMMFVFAGNGGGVHVYDSQFTMNNGKIYGNTASSSGAIAEHQNGDSLTFIANGGGVFVSGQGLSGVTEVTRFYMNGGEIRDNHVIGAVANNTSISGNGGGVASINRAQFHMTDGLIMRNTVTDNTPNPTTNGSRRGNGAGVYLVSFGTEFVFDMSGGEISRHNDVARYGVGVYLASGRMDLSGTARIENNHSTDDGGGIFVEGNAVLNMDGGLISKNTAQREGGGIYFSSNGSTFNMKSGSITNNIAYDGGGVFVPHENLSANLSNVTIDEAAEFSGNIARNGARINNNLAASTRPRINPSTVSIAWVEENPVVTGNFAEAGPHVFTNYDINATGPRFWRVTYGVGEGEGEVDASIGSNRVQVKNGYFVPDGARVSFDAEPQYLFSWWNIGTRTTEITEDGKDAIFNFSNGGTNTFLSRTITANTHALGNFLKGITITYHPNGGLGEPYVQHVAMGTHYLNHVVTHGGIDGVSVSFMGWNTEPDGSGVAFAAGESILVSEHVILYAQWNLEVSMLTISKTVDGIFSNPAEEFDFIVIFTDSVGAPLPPGTQFSYTGDIIAGSGAIAPENGILTLNESGSATFKLGDGQAIKIDNIPVNSRARVIELYDGNYAVSFIDSENDGVVVNGNDTTLLRLTQNRTFSFTNKRSDIPMTGINLGNVGAVVMLPALLSLSGGVVIVSGKVYRRRKSLSKA